MKDGEKYETTVTLSVNCEYKKFILIKLFCGNGWDINSHLVGVENFVNAIMIMMMIMLRRKFCVLKFNAMWILSHYLSISHGIFNLNPGIKKSSEMLSGIVTITIDYIEESSHG